MRVQFREAEYRILKSTFMGKTILFADHGQDWTDERIVRAYHAQHQVERTLVVQKMLATSASVPPSIGPARSCAYILYPALKRSKRPVVQTRLSKMNDRQKELASVLGLDRFLHN